MGIKQGFRTLLEILALADGDPEATQKAANIAKAASADLCFDDIREAVYKALSALAPPSPPVTIVDY